MASLVCALVMILAVISSNNEIFIYYSLKLNCFKFLRSVDRGVASFCPICSGICSCNYSCPHRFSLLCGCLSKRFDSPIVILRNVSWPWMFSLIYQWLIFSSDPTYVVAPVLESRSGREELKKLFAGQTTSLTQFLIQWLIYICEFDDELVSFKWFWNRFFFLINIFLN